jgi:DNA-binding NtrC family response regulator
LLSIHRSEQAKKEVDMAPQLCPYAAERPKSRTILLVEDEAFVREATCTILESAGFEVLTAEDAIHAIKVFEQCQRHVDLLMTDIVLPGRSGLQLGEDLLRRSADMNVLVTSGYSNAESTTDDPESRTFFLAKPYSRRGLIEMIEKILADVPFHRAASQAG